ncbi:DUF1918 domain-containing protein [Actinomycetospora callitridis]|uniref:DUF1918 domain-containing protein n=1 Tax=Actinomycetospora callitridis TaxID=913944 RepID=UPI002365BFCD|nr:DUF1918 domain-containing protein [Actinomycetospora callitridis]MDD7919565.1 DUF1918 domain-containing protein [Actinomycetospora callitridis]
MSASVGDRIRMHSNHTDVPDRVGTVVGVLGEDGPPYRVRFDSGEETIVTPGPDATFEAGSLADKAGLAAEKAEEKAGELAGKAGQAASDATGTAARAVADVADQVAQRFQR